MAKWRTSENPLRMATIVGFIASDSGSDREVLCLSRLGAPLVYRAQCITYTLIYGGKPPHPLISDLNEQVLW